MGSETPQRETILAAAVAQGLELLPFDEANRLLIELHQQMGELECANAALKEAVTILKSQKKALKSRNAALEDGIKAISAKCCWRNVEACFVNCPGRSFCDTAGLSLVYPPETAVKAEAASL